MKTVEIVENYEKTVELLKTVKNCGRGVAAHRYNTQLYNTS